MISIVIAAHNEAAVIGRCLDALLADAAPGQLDITVVANGCTDDTALTAASRPGVRVVERAEAGKPAALNAGDAVAAGFPRVYLDADIVLSAHAAQALADALSDVDGVLAAVPGRRFDLAGRPLLVRAFFAINSRLPAYRDGLFGRGAIALSASARGRFARFPEEIADDLFLDSLFTTREKCEVGAVTAHIATPRRTRDLLRRLIRVRRSNAKTRAAGAGADALAPVRPARRLSWLQDVVLPRPWLIPAAVCYVGITVAAALAARRAPHGGWGRDESSRQHAHSATSRENDV